MGLFSFAKSALPHATDKVWKTNQACMKGIATEALLCMKKSELAFVVTLFEESHKSLVNYFDSLKVPFQVVNRLDEVEELHKENKVAVLNADTPGIFGNRTGQQTKTSIFIFGRNPALKIENGIIEILSAYFPNAMISFCLSLDQPLFKFFGADHIISLMGTLGMKEEEYIEHAMVSKAISRALEKVNKALVTEIKTYSEQEWFAINGEK